MNAARKPDNARLDDDLLPSASEGFEFKFGDGWAPCTAERALPSQLDSIDAPSLQELILRRHLKASHRSA
jgi:hypothetical protein